MHIDGTFVPLGPGKILVNPKRPCITGDHKSFFTFQGQSKVRPEFIIHASLVWPNSLALPPSLPSPPAPSIAAIAVAHLPNIQMHPAYPHPS